MEFLIKGCTYGEEMNECIYLIYSDIHLYK